MPARVENTETGDGSNGAAESPVLSVIVPVYNELENVEDTLTRVLAVPLDLELLVIDDCSDDGTREFLEEFAEKHPRIRLFRHPYNMGNGAAVKTGMRNVRAEALLILDADGQHPPEDIPRFYK